MVETDEGVSFPIVFYDGERDKNIGHVAVSDSMEFKNFQSILSKKVGISSHQFTVYLADYRTSNESPAKIRRRIPITGKVNFGAISNEKNSFFLVVLKKSRRERRRKGHDNNEDEYYYPTMMKTNTQQPKKKNPPENVMLLRRNRDIDNQSFSGIILDRFEYDQRIRKIQMEKEKYLINMGLRELTVSIDSGRDGALKLKNVTVVCRNCLNAEETGVDAGFHCCANDAVTKGFRSHAGPIARPMK